MYQIQDEKLTGFLHPDFARPVITDIRVANINDKIYMTESVHYHLRRQSWFEQLWSNFENHFVIFKNIIYSTYVEQVDMTKIVDRLLGELISSKTYFSTRKLVMKSNSNDLESHSFVFAMEESAVVLHVVDKKSYVEIAASNCKLLDFYVIKYLNKCGVKKLVSSYIHIRRESDLKAYSNNNINFDKSAYTLANEVFSRPTEYKHSWNFMAYSRKLSHDVQKLGSINIPLSEDQISFIEITHSPMIIYPGHEVSIERPLKQAKKVWDSYPNDAVSIKYFLYPLLLAHFDVIGCNVNDPSLILMRPRDFGGWEYYSLSIVFTNEIFFDELVNKVEKIVAEFSKKKVMKHFITRIHELKTGDEKKVKLEEVVCSKPLD